MTSGSELGRADPVGPRIGTAGLAELAEQLALLGAQGVGQLQRRGEEQITAAGFRDLISASRKYSIPLLDYFDRSGVTVRSGDYRRALRRP